MQSELGNLHEQPTAQVWTCDLQRSRSSSKVLLIICVAFTGWHYNVWFSGVRQTTAGNVRICYLLASWAPVFPPQFHHIVCVSVCRYLSEDNERWPKGLWQEPGIIYLTNKLFYSYTPLRNGHLEIHSYHNNITLIHTLYSIRKTTLKTTSIIYK